MTKQRTAPNPNVAINLKFLMDQRPELGSQPLLAKRSGVGQTTIGRILRGEVSPTAENLRKICEALECEVTFIYWNPARFESTYRTRVSEGLPMKLPVGEIQIRSVDLGARVNEPIPKYDVILPRHAALISLFESLPKSEQDSLIKSLEEKKQHYDLLLEELITKRRAN